MLVLVFRAFILYTFAIIIMRMMGKREIGQMQPFELAITLIISEALATPMENTNEPLLNGIIPVLTIVFSQLLFSYLTLKSEKLQEIMSGKPSIMLKDGIINEKNLRNQNYNITELLEQLRLNGVDKISDVEYAVLETNGQLSVILKPEKRAVTVEDLGIQKIDDGIPLNLVLDGKLVEKNLSHANITKEELESELKKNGLTIEEAFFVVMTSSNEYIIQRKGG
ncbi:MAG: DUF421 domain-containing protein [Clostridia bacterium]|nr:DUF421 domain-containing protein [Clostridia bacterium]